MFDVTGLQPVPEHHDGALPVILAAEGQGLPVINRIACRDSDRSISSLSFVIR